MSTRKLRVLCLHGCRQDAKTFNMKTGQLRKGLKRLDLELEYISAPHSIRSLDTNDDYDFRSWWYTSSDKTYNSKEASEIDEGFQESLNFIRDYIKDNGPFDGVLGFSQGASLLGIICCMIHRKEFDAEFKFVILFSGFKSLCIPHEKYYQIATKINIPSLHVMGASDSIIGKERSEELMGLFENPELLQHPGRHHVPAGKGEREVYINFFKKMISLSGIENLPLSNGN